VQPPFRQPPRTRSHNGQLRRVGVELEFAALSADAGAEAVQSLFGGEIERRSPHRFHVRATRLGDFTCELDVRLAHDPDPAAAKLSDDERPPDGILDRLKDQLRESFGDLSAAIMPYEIVCPPIAIDQVDQLEALLGALREAGARGTRASPLYAFGVQFNPELADGGVAWITAVLKSHLLLSDWLRAVMRIDPSRRLSAFATPFPAAYATLVLDRDYWPESPQLIDDYLTHNPTRNRELDMLPLLGWLDEDRVRATVTDPRLKTRPALHYRLPDANLDDPDWCLAVEWNRWLVVERLAERRDLLEQMGQSYLANQDKWLRERWALRASEWLMTA